MLELPFKKPMAAGKSLPNLMAWLSNIGAWALSPIGQGVAAWLSAVVGVVAILLALIVALAEYRRANADQAREAKLQREEVARRQQEERADKVRFVHMCAELIEAAAKALDAEVQRLPSDLHYTTWNRQQGTPRLMRPMYSSLIAMQAVRQDDPALVLTLSRAIQTLDDLIDAPLFGSPSTATAIAYAKPKIQELLWVRQEILALSPDEVT